MNWAVGLKTAGLAASHRETGFDLARAPLLKMALIRQSEEFYLFIWSFTHLLLDNRSSRQIFDEVLTVYTLLIRDQQLPQPASSPVQNYSFWSEMQDITAPK